LQRKSDFVPTTTSTKAENYRRSLVLHSFPKFRELMVNRIKEIFPGVLNKLNIPIFSIAEIESQLTAHNDQNFYKVHNDNGSPNTATRVLTYVYYFYREPKAFTEGKLIIYDSQIQGKHYVKATTFKTIEPRNNSIVFFLSRYMHEVLPVTCPSQDFADSRFTINGWIRRS
jgi:Predicted proline hydroxylase